MFRNNGDDSFTGVTTDLVRPRDGSPGVFRANGNTAVFLDLNLDGCLDIYVG